MSGSHFKITMEAKVKALMGNGFVCEVCGCLDGTSSLCPEGRREVFGEVEIEFRTRRSWSGDIVGM